MDNSDFITKSNDVIQFDLDQLNILVKHRDNMFALVENSYGKNHYEKWNNSQIFLEESQKTTKIIKEFR